MNNELKTIWKEAIPLRQHEKSTKIFRNIFNIVASFSSCTEEIEGNMAKICQRLKGPGPEAGWKSVNNILNLEFVPLHHVPIVQSRHKYSYYNRSYISGISGTKVLSVTIIFRKSERYI
jgi:hypothetical protein